MVWDDAQQTIRCVACGGEFLPRGASLSEDEKARLASYAVRYQQRAGFRLSPTRDLGNVRG